MNLALYIYLCDVMNNLKEFSVGISFLLSVIVIICMFFFFITIGVEHEKTQNALSKKIIYWTFPFILFFVALSIFIPSKKTMYAMAAAYYGEQAVKSETFQRLNGKAMQLLEVKIDELLEVKGK